MPGPAPGPVKLAPGVLYVVKAQAKCVVRCHPPGLVTVAPKTGPREFTARFVDGTGGIEDRTYDAPVLYVLQANGVGRACIDVIPFGFQAEHEIVSTVLDVDDGSKPEPVKPDPVKPDPVKPKPAAAVKLKAVAVYESEDASLAADAFFGSPELAARWKDRGHLPPVVADRNAKDPATGATPAKLKPYVDRAAGKALPQLYLVDAATSDVLYEGPLPATPAELMTILAKVGG